MGRPRKYETVEALEGAIDIYFTNCPDTKKVFVTRYDTKGKKKKVSIDFPYPTISGLALHLGFSSRSTFYAYEGYKEFSDTIKKAHLYIEREYEMRLPDFAAGAIFALKNLGWKDTPMVDQSVHKHFTIVKSYKDGEGNGKRVHINTEANEGV